MPDTSHIDSPGIFYRKSGSGPALVLLHGFPANSLVWRNICVELSVSYTVITPDLPGSGKSDLQGAAGMNDMAKLLKDIVDREKTGKVVIAGHSMGGYVALAFAAMYPDMVAGLSLVHSTSAADDEEKVKTRKKSIQLIQKGGKSQFVSQMIPNLFSPAFKQSHPLVIMKQIEESMEMTDAGMVNFYNAMIAREDTTGVLTLAGFPVQWICGLDDNVIPYKKILPKCHEAGINFVSFYNNCGHMSMMEAPNNLVADLADFASYSYSRNTDNHE